MTTRFTLHKTLAGALAAAGLALAATTAAAAGPAYYYDGDRKVAILAQADLVADFSRQRSTAQSATATGQALPAKVAGDSVVRIYRASAAAALPADGATASSRSPVFRQGGTAAGRLMALPGGVLVKFRPEWSRAQVDAWLAARGLPAGQPLAIGPGWFLVGTPAGVAALEAANTLFESGEVLSASPNWWMQTSTK